MMVPKMSDYEGNKRLVDESVVFDLKIKEAIGGRHESWLLIIQASSIRNLL